MKNIVLVIVVAVIGFGCSDKNCVKVSDIAFGDLQEGTEVIYNYELDTFAIKFPQYVTPNNDNVNDTIFIETNIQKLDVISAKFRMVDGCDNVVFSDDANFPFVFPNPSVWEDGQYDFSFTVILPDNKPLSGSGVLRVISK